MCLQPLFAACFSLRAGGFAHDPSMRGLTPPVPPLPKPGGPLHGRRANL